MQSAPVRRLHRILSQCNVSNRMSSAVLAEVNNLHVIADTDEGHRALEKALFNAEDDDSASEGEKKPELSAREKKLESWGVKSMSFHKRDTFLGSSTPDRFGFNLRQYFATLQSKKMGRAVVYGDSVSSTQTLLFDKFYSIPADAGAVFTCHRQVSGKGRSKNVWESPPGCLMFTVKTGVTNPKRLPFVQYLVSLSMVRAVKSFPQCEELPIRIKWPNDLYCGGGKIKIGGVLCQSSYLGGSFDICAGVGINVDNSHPTTCLNEMYRAMLRGETIEEATSKMDSLDDGEGTPAADLERVFTRERLLARFLTQFEKDMDLFNKKGFAPFKEEYLANWLHTGQEVTLKNKRKTVVIKGLTDSGYLKAQDTGRFKEMYELHPDGNSFDFLKGLIIQKVIKDDA